MGDFQRIRQWVILGVLVVAGLFAFYDRMYRGKRLKVISLKGELVSVQSQVTQMEILARSGEASDSVLREMQREIDQLGKEVEIGRQNLPQEMRLSQLLNLLTQDTIRGPVQFAEFRPSPVVRTGEVAEIPFQLNAVATFKEFGQFMGRAETLPILIEVESLKMTPVQPGDPTLNVLLKAKGKILR